MRTRQTLCMVVLAGADLAAPVPGLADHVPGHDGQGQFLVNRDGDGLGIQGYDPVAYFTLQRPVKGDPRWRAAHAGATYQFASAENKRLFEQDPARYTPAFGGYCGYAASINKLSPISPEFFQVLDGRLVLQHNQRAWDLWNKDVAGNLRKADENWPGLVERNARPGKLLVNVDRTGLALQGYDPVAYFTARRPLPGKPEFSAVFNGARYHFADAANKEAFEREPARYEPQFGGYCGYAASINKISPIDPTIWQIIDGRLVLQHTQKAYDLFNRDAVASLDRADRNWPGLVERKGR